MAKKHRGRPKIEPPGKLPRQWPRLKKLSAWLRTNLNIRKLRMSYVFWLFVWVSWSMLLYYLPRTVHLVSSDPALVIAYGTATYNVGLGCFWAGIGVAVILLPIAGMWIVKQFIIE